ncbi:glycosyltransferase family 39 protein [Streptomyces microflavus]|uniref:ArnT family glycosyltransferase n=1 Tax=Streptomyces microflavus TaxID=1919 RepID=UPI0033A217AC
MTRHARPSPETPYAGGTDRTPSTPGAPGTDLAPSEPDVPTLALRVVPDGGRKDWSSSVPETPDAAWSPAGGGRRLRVARATLGAVLAVQALLAFRRPPAVSPFEALSLVTGHAAMSGGAHEPWSVPGQAGAPRSYPVLAALADQLGGVDAARTVSLALMLLTTVLLYGLTTRLFNIRAGLCAAALFAVLPSTAVLGGSATPEAAGLCLLAAVAQLLVGTDRAVRWAALCAVMAAGLAVFTQHWTALGLPPVLLLAAVRTAGSGGRSGERAGRRSRAEGDGRARRRPGSGGAGRSGGRAVLVAVVASVMAVVVALVLRGAWLPGESLFPAVAGDGRSFSRSGPATGLLLAVALVGAGFFLVRDRMGEHPSALAARHVQGRGARVLWIVAFLIAAVAPLTVAGAGGPSGYGLGPVAALTWFAAPLAGVGTSRLMGRHFRFPQAGIAVWTALLCAGLPQTDRWFAGDPDSARLVRFITPYAGATGTYLGVPAEVPAYQLRRTVQPGQWTDCAGTTDGTRLGASADAAVTCARSVRAGEFRVIVLDGATRPAVQAAVREALRGNAHYRLVAELGPYGTGTGAGYRIWVKAG